ncbi:uncharacterized protein Z518_01612 [Rhinocladiella mackenziei CBS 650.93]|uniref:Uncharacterized protein n=1 Tax=Rhinocladiella mackenziei CBS 650.93 TaxID=1442369 RepID=A0A0D2IX19_9EURO|nr:uncharacterized protein Z518_01612 [Rhinocladiella mackenziei CBS 650.93]KIX10529.1 hypothetical protein Z518_01612 [Rhinocladiella mackenziei CBS 650.93]
MPSLAFEMPDYAKVTREQRVSYISSFVRWLQLKKYQYEVTFSLYMLTPTEKFIFNLILFILVSLLVTAASLYLPNHVAIIYNRIWYYVHGEFAYMTAGAPAGSGSVEKATYAADGLRLASEAFRSVSPTVQAVGESAKSTLREL